MISDEDYKGLKTEITACMCLCPKNEGDKGYNQGMRKALEFIEKYHDKVDWNWISISQTLSEEFIEKHQDKVNWGLISQSQTLSEKFIEKYQDKVDWDCISQYQTYQKSL